MSSYTDEQLNKLHEKLPEELAEALYSSEVAEIIGNTCQKYGIGDERVTQIAAYVGDVLVGLLLPSEFEDAIRKNVQLPEVLVKAISNEINRFVFFPHKIALEQLHERIGEKVTDRKNIGIETPRHSDRGGEYFAEPEEQESQEDNSKETEEKRPIFTEDEKGPDQYREPID